MSAQAVGEAARRTSDERDRQVRAGVRIEIVTLIWMTVEAAVGIGAGVVARSVLLTAFGLDSVIELVTGGALLWRLATEARGGSLARVEWAERRAAWIAGIGLALLCAYVVVLSALSLLTRVRADASPVGIALAAVALAGMPLLARRKRRIAAAIESPALRGDAACSITCAYMAGALLLGLLARALFGWWWADSLAALALLIWLVPETREALDGARSGRAACACGDDDCAE
ncbi:MAG TPA: cation transporter [Ktedonobacterales bacterium]|nr:cation transporter [Ktedonobacterales bacterium]